MDASKLALAGCSIAPSRDLVSGDFGTLLDTFYSAIDDQARRRGKPEPCPKDWTPDHKTFALDVSSSILDAGRMALQDHLAGHSRFLTCSAPTGSGKSSYSWALVAAVAQTYHEASVVFACETIQQCEATYWGLREMMGIVAPPAFQRNAGNVVGLQPPDLVVFTGAHDSNKKWEEIRMSYPTFSPTVDPSSGRVVTRRFHRSDLEVARVAVVTHNMLLSGKAGENGRTYNGRPRTLTIIDEKINEVAMYDIGLGDVCDARDWAAGQFCGNAPADTALQSLLDYLTAAWESERPTRKRTSRLCRAPRRSTLTGSRALRLTTSSVIIPMIAPSVGWSHSLGLWRRVTPSWFALVAQSEEDGLSGTG